jgi:hypothetical protein
MTIADPEVFVVPSFFRDSGPQKRQRVVDVSVEVDSINPVLGPAEEIQMFRDLPSDDETPPE